MKCPSCGAENRPDVRFCRKCGQPMQGAAPPPPEPPPQPQETPSQAQPQAQPKPQAQAQPQPPPAAAGPPPGTGVVCPSCGANVKPGARFCPRCGQAIQAGGEPQPTPKEAQPSPAAGPQRYAQPPQPVPPAEQPSAAPASSGPPPAAAPPPPAKKGGPPLWIWIIGGIVLLIIIAGAAVGVWYVFLRDGEDEADVTPTPTITATTEEVVTPEATPTPTPPATATPEPTTAPTTGGLNVNVDHSVLPPSPQAGVPLALTVLVTNTGTVPIEIGDVQLLKAWQDYLEPMPRPPNVSGIVVEPGQSQAALFNFRALQPGDATIQILVIGDVLTEPRTTEQYLAEPFSLTIGE